MNSVWSQLRKICIAVKEIFKELFYILKIFERVIENTLSFLLRIKCQQSIEIYIDYSVKD
jgi:hypothetical protein